MIHASRLNILPPLIYEHYGVYIGNDEVIHFTDKGAHKVTLPEFISYANRSDCYVKPFPESRTALKIILKNRMKTPDDVEKMLAELDKAGYQFFSGAKVVQRAISAVGSPKWAASEYSLRNKNCEHFAFWCKTGVEHSTQIDHYSKIVFD